MIYNHSNSGHSGSNLYKAIRWSERQMQPFRDMAKQVLREILGDRWGGSEFDAHVAVPDNKLELYYSTLLRELAAGAPRVILSTHIAQYKRDAKLHQLELNMALKELNFGRVLYEVVRDALSLFGMAKIYPRYTGDMPDPTGGTIPIGEPFIGRVSPWRSGLDMGAERHDEAQYWYDYYRMDYEDVMESSVFEGKKHLIEKSHRRRYSPEGYERASGLGGHADDYGTEFGGTVELLDVYIPQQKLMLTLDAWTEGVVLLVNDWDGPNPYRMLGFSWITDQLIPLPPLSTVIDLHEAINMSMRKSFIQAENQKTVYVSEQSEEMERVKDAEDVSFLRSPKDAVGAIQTGGVDASNMAFRMNMSEVFNINAGNLNALAGLGASSATATQDRMISQSSHQKIQAMEQAVEDFVRDSCKALLAWIWKDPLRVKTYDYTEERLGLRTPVTIGPANRRGRNEDYHVEIAPYSYKRKTPHEKLQMLRTVWNQDILPLLPLLAQGGRMPDVIEYLRQIQELGDLPEVQNLIGYATNIQEDTLSLREGGRMPQNTTRTNVRVNRPEMTAQGQMRDQFQNWMSLAGRQDSGISALGR